MMLRSLFYTAFIFLLTAGVSISQTQLSEKNRPRVNVVVPSGELDETVNLIEGNVVMVHDGDNISIAARDGSIYSVRLQGIDAPETAQTNGRESAQQLAALIQGMDVVVVVRKRDQNDRYIAAVYLDGEDVGLLLLKKGLAWNYPKYNFEPFAGNLKIYEQAEQTARTGKLGLWKDSKPISPWEFRGEKNLDASQNPTIASKTTTDAAVKNTPTGTAPKSANSSSPAAGRKYILGPRGGCYYLNERGIKVYVSNKSLCYKQP